MIEIKVESSIVSVQKTEPLYSGSADVHTCHFEFNANWERFSKSTVFRVGGRSVTAVIQEDGCCNLPWELLTRANIGLEIEVGVYGVSSEAEILTSVWDSIGTVRDGSEIGNDAREPGAGVYDQIMASVQRVNEKVGNYSGEMVVFLQRAESAAKVASGSSAVAVSSAEEAAKSEDAAQSAAAATQDALKGVQAALDSMIRSGEELDQAVTEAAGSAAAAKGSENATALSAAEAQAAANRAQAEAERVSVPAAVGVYNVILTDRVTAGKYALIVEGGRLSLLGVSEELDSAEVNIVDNSTGTAYKVAVEDGRILLEEV